MKYYKSEDSFFAIDKIKNMVYQCFTSSKCTSVEVWNDQFMIEVIEEKTDMVEISAEKFQENFSKAVCELHTNTPFV